ncbi:hypothetical protein [Streptomyces sp. DK15]|nr:hypothetical protein [Streptomyces sp. DK15]
MELYAPGEAVVSAKPDEEATTDTLHKLSKSSPDQVLFTGGL